MNEMQILNRVIMHLREQMDEIHMEVMGQPIPVPGPDATPEEIAAILPNMALRDAELLGFMKGMKLAIQTIEGYTVPPDTSGVIQ